MASQISRKGRLWGLLYGDLEGEFVFRKGRLVYSFDEDQFRLFDNEGNQVLMTDLGEHVEGFLIENGWAGVRG